MKNLQFVFYTLLAALIITVTCAVVRDPAWRMVDDSRRAPARISLGCRTPGGLPPSRNSYTTVRLHNETDDGLPGDAVLLPAIEDSGAGTHAGKRNEVDQWVAQADRILAHLWADGQLTLPVSLACAVADTSPVCGTPAVILEQFRLMHYDYCKWLVMDRAGQKPAGELAHPGDDILLDLQIIKQLAAELRFESIHLDGVPRSNG